MYVFLPVKYLFMTCGYFLLSYLFLTNLYWCFFKLWDIYFSLLLDCMCYKIISQFVMFFFSTLFVGSFDAKKLLIFTRPNPSVFLYNLHILSLKKSFLSPAHKCILFCFFPKSLKNLPSTFNFS